jgi:transposase-like protein/predicted RNA-binding Zn-ribbon protein involved in translation (DUF1610 family)
MKFTINDFNRRFPNDDICLEEIMKLRYGNLKVCPDCEKETKFHKVRNRKCYECQWCGYQIYPTKGTVFEKTTTSLRLWFYAIYLMTQTRSGVSAKEIERQLGVTYKCAWRIAHQIRILMDYKDTKKLTGEVEVDETYFGGKAGGKRGRGANNKTPILDLAQRQGKLKAEPIDNTKSSTITPIIKKNINANSIIITDEYRSYNALKFLGYNHERVNHGTGQWVRNNAHTNSIEGFWSIFKRSIRGTHVWVSKKHLRKYINEFVFRYNQRENPSLMFDSTLAHLK